MQIQQAMAAVMSPDRNPPVNAENTTIRRRTAGGFGNLNVPRDRSSMAAAEHATSSGPLSCRQRDMFEWSPGCFVAAPLALNQDENKLSVTFPEFSRTRLIQGGAAFARFDLAGPTNVHEEMRILYGRPADGLPGVRSWPGRPRGASVECGTS